MQPRRDIISQFSTFLQFEGDRPRPWLTDPRLRRSIERRLATRNQSDLLPMEANFWALFWHKQWLKHQPTQPATSSTVSPNRPNPNQQLPQNHLTAYAQTGCYWAAQKTTTRFKNLPYGLSDCFQLAIAQFVKILRGFDPSYGSDFSTYANAAFASLIRETLRQRNEVDICTDWGLLRKLSKKRLTEALQAQGLGEPNVQASIIVWQGFKLHYVPNQATGTRKLTKPDVDVLGAIAAYSAAQSRDQGLGKAAQQISPADVENNLLTAAKAARQYLYPTQLSVNAQQAGQETEFIDSLPETNELSPMEDLLETETLNERQNQRQELSDILSGLLAALDDEAQALLCFYYRDGLTQQEMAKRLNVKQYSISRRLSRIRQGLVKKLAQWSTEKLHTPLDLDLLNSVSSLLDEWLQHHYQAESSLDS